MRDAGLVEGSPDAGSRRWLPRLQGLLHAASLTGLVASWALAAYLLLHALANILAWGALDGVEPLEAVPIVYFAYQVVETETTAAVFFGLLLAVLPVAAGIVIDSWRGRPLRPGRAHGVTFILVAFIAVAMLAVSTAFLLVPPIQPWFTWKGLLAPIPDGGSTTTTLSIVIAAAAMFLSTLDLALGPNALRPAGRRVLLGSGVGLAANIVAWRCMQWTFLCRPEALPHEVLLQSLVPALLGLPVLLVLALEVRARRDAPGRVRNSAPKEGA